MIETDELLSANFTYFWKGRVALYALLKSVGVSEGSEVVVPGFTCVVVPNAVLYTGATPVYADIDASTYNVSLETIRAVVTDRTKAIVVQSTFGLSPDLDGILQFAKDLNIPVIDDCTHGLGGSYKSIPNGFVTDAAFFSTQWSKPLSTGLGGFVTIKNEELKAKLNAEIEAYEPADAIADNILALQRLVRPLADIRQLHYPLIKTYRWLTQKVGLSVGSSSGDEISGITMPDNYCRLAGKRQKRAIIRRFGTLDSVLAKRQRSAQFYDQYFGTFKNIVVPVRPSYALHGMLRYTVQVEDSKAVFEKAVQNNIPLGDWFDSPIYPVYKDLSKWKYFEGSCPVAERVSRKIVNLSTDNVLDRKQLDLLFGAYS